MGTYTPNGKNKNNPVQNFFEKRTHPKEWRYIALVALAALALGVVGFMENFQEFKGEARAHGGSQIWFAAIYHSLQLLILNGPSFDAPIPVTLELGRFLGALVFFWAVFKIVITTLYMDFNRAMVWFKKGHVVICGLGKLGLPLAIQALNKGLNPVAIERDINAEGVREAIKRKIPVVIGDARELQTLKRARAMHAKKMYVACSEEAVNIGVASMVGRLTGGAPSECCLFISDPKLRAALKKYVSFRRGKYSINVHGLDIHAVSARKAFDQLPLNHLNLPVGSKKRPRLIIVGFGQMGKALANQAAKIAHFPSGELLEITVVDKNAAELVKDFKAEVKNYKHLFKFDCIEGSPNESRVRESIFEKFKEADGNGELLACCVCHDDNDTQNLAFSLESRELSGCRTPFLVHMKGNADFLKLFSTKEPHLPTPELIPFGMMEDIWTLDTLENEVQDKIARACHENYLNMMEAWRKKELQKLGQSSDEKQVEKIRKKKPAEKPWEQLEETYREANRAFADHIAIKLHAVGLKISSDNIWSRQNHIQLKDFQIEMLSMMEHSRWCAERWLDGWTWSEKRNDEEKRHPMLVPWDDLDESTKNIDRELIHRIFKILKLAGKRAAPIE